MLDVIARLDTENEHLRLRLLERSEWMEEVVTREVAGERRIADLEQRNRALEAELQSIRQSRTWRLIAPVRTLYGRVRMWLARR